MLSPQVRQTILTLHAQNHSHHAISRMLKLSRNTVKRVIHEGAVEARRSVQPSRDKEELLGLLPEVFKRCLGNVVRIQEVFKDEYHQSVAYSTLTQWCRDANLRAPKRRFGQYLLAPGEEMQHDTSPHKVTLGDRQVKAQCASLTLAFSRRLFIQYYPRFTRFEARVFLHDALDFMDGVCQRCVIDNTSVLLAAGSGADAVVAAEIEIFARLYGFQFMAHRIGDANRKARVERPFHYAEHNFLAGRTFRDWDDLNAQARQWCEQKANQKIKRELGMSPEQAYLQEKSALQALPTHVPPIYEVVHRVVDTEGYVHLETNRYSVHEKWVGHSVDVFKFIDHVEVHYRRRVIAKHRRAIGQRYARITAPDHHPPFYTQRHREGVCTAEQDLRKSDQTLNHYIDAIKKRVRGRGAKPLQRLLNLKRTYPKAAFEAAIAQAVRYGLFDLHRLEDLILSYVAKEFFHLEDD